MTRNCHLIRNDVAVMTKKVKRWSYKSRRNNNTKLKKAKKLWKEKKRLMRRLSNSRKRRKRQWLPWVSK